MLMHLLNRNTYTQTHSVHDEVTVSRKQEMVRMNNDLEPNLKCINRTDVGIWS